MTVHIDRWLIRGIFLFDREENHIRVYKIQRELQLYTLRVVSLNNSLIFSIQEQTHLITT